MAFDFGKISPPKKEDLVVDPVEIFQKNKGKISDKSINDLWLGQGDALRDWHDNRARKDVAIVLNTGAGKTLIGLLVAQSLVNETKGKVVYACGSIQLIEQTREKADGYGLSVTTYHSGKFSNDLFSQGKAVCLTTYQALFNGRSKFRSEDIDAIIFDDAHTAEGMIKNHFSIDIERRTNPDLYAGISELFRPYFHDVGKSASYKELIEGQNERVELLPTSEVRANVSEIYRLIAESGINEEKPNVFPWAYLKDHLDLCSYFVSSGSIQITPPFIPVGSLPYFSNEVRRVYLTATMLGPDAFIRTFGRELEYVVKPKTTAGECERLILFPGQKFGFDEEVEKVKSLLSEDKVLVLASSNYMASRWKGFADFPRGTDVTEAISSFRDSDDDSKIVLAGRYDGIDLPGDTCRHMVLDGLPSGVGLFDRYLWSSLNLASALKSTIACRIVQSLGRISRGMSDFGVVCITDKNYVKWLLVPKNQSALPDFVQKQISLGLQVTEASSGLGEMEDAISTFLNRDAGWLESYERFMEDCSTEDCPSDMSLLVDFAKIEVKFARFYWERDFERAITTLRDILDRAFAYSLGLGSWYCLWIGYCCEILGQDGFKDLYQRSYGASKAIPRYRESDIKSPDEPYSDQIFNVTNEFQIGSGAEVKLPKNISENLRHLDGSGSVAQIEESLRFLGQYLGLESIRPDKEFGTGPDVLWVLDYQAFVIEAKTDKSASNEYSKSYVGQLVQHVNWVNDHNDLERIIPVFVGPVSPASDSANPTDDMMVAELEKFNELAERLVSAYEDIRTSALPITLPGIVDTILSERGLRWPEVVDFLELNQLKSLK